MENDSQIEDDSNFISILSDYGFKLTFADESDTTFLRRALQALIQSEYPIEKVQFLSNEFVGLTKKAKAGLYDLICEDEKGNTFIVEMQLGYYKNYIQRAKFYAFQRFNTLIAKGQYLFDDLTPIYCIGFLAKPIFPNSEQYYHFATLKNQEGEELDAQITHIIVEIAKFGKKEEELITDLDKLIYFMTNQEIIKKLEELPKVLSEDWMDQAINILKLNKSQMDPEQRMHFEMMLARNASIIQMEKEEKEQAIKKAVEEIEKVVEEKEREIEKVVEEKEREIEKVVVEKDQEIEEAVKEIELRAKEEQKEIAKKTARKLLSKGMGVEEISEITGLTHREIGGL